MHIPPDTRPCRQYAEDEVAWFCFITGRHLDAFERELLVLTVSTALNVGIHRGKDAATTSRALMANVLRRN